LAFETVSNLCRCATYERMRQAIEFVHAQRSR
jgi:aerobic-type carbon monoxide dehydrogenase small subunit (CoxS/CutS family)